MNRSDTEDCQKLVVELCGLSSGKVLSDIGDSKIFSSRLSESSPDYETWYRLWGEIFNIMSDQIEKEDK